MIGPSSRSGDLRPCEGPCGRMTRNTRMSKEMYPDTVTRVTATHCQSCNKALKALDPDHAEVLAEQQARKDQLAADRIAAAHRAREAVEADRAARRHRGAARRISLGQSTVRI